MRVVKILLSLLLALGCGTVGWTTAAEKGSAETAEKAKLRVGTFDSRAVAIAYFNSEMRQKHTRQLMDEYEKAKATKDQEKITQLEALRHSNEVRVHQQGFGTASVANILTEIKEQLPGIAQEAGVDVLVSKWDLAYQSPSAELVDVTDLLIKPFHPNERVLGWIKDLKQHPPVPQDELAKELKGHLEQHDDSGKAH